ncbi:MAG: MerR family transcriptional regulator [Chitinispirillia bacterium]|nr:MerR family transcriptional regulator [Chitinispirillia bacterium]
MSEKDSNKCEQLCLLDLKKMYYSISEVCSATSLEPHVLRYWESEFPTLRPKKNRGGKRAYQDKDIEVICQIKRLLYEEKYTISGARQKLSEDRQTEAASQKRSRSKSNETQVDDDASSQDSSALEESILNTCSLESSSQSIQSAQISPDLINDMKKELEEILALLK